MWLAAKQVLPSQMVPEYSRAKQQGDHISNRGRDRPAYPGLFK
jgi:hypothetical protein